ncbi:MAG: 2Fe-2S iron-sulfur cluster binding domain-containing protein, partial [Desulfobacterales bacterium]|nr:2Fe-2S iron-sulfur cluster binding domain-containing protein [Desulfobacterales bacterium]
MGKCANHPDRETSYICMKHDKYMCEECLACPDPEIHCKFRSSCPVWFMDKRGGKNIDDIPDKPEKNRFKVVFMPDNKDVLVEKNTTLLEAVQAADIPLNASCNGKGVCGKCKLVVESGMVESAPTPLLNDEEKRKKYVLACQTTVQGDVTVKIPEEVLEKKLRIAGTGKQVTEELKGMVKGISPMLSRIPLELNPPTLEDSISDLDRLNRCLKKSGVDIDRMNIGIKAMRGLSGSMRGEDWNVTAFVVKKKCSSEVLEVVSGNLTAHSFGIAVDVGTTSIVVYLVDMENGSILAATSGHNRQAACGDDVINRIVCAEKDGVSKLSEMVLSTINGLINEAINSADVDREKIDNVVISGNTTMTHLLLGIEPRHIRRDPYIPSV